MVAAQVTAALGLLRRGASGLLLCLALAVAATGIGVGRVAMALLLPSDPHGYTVSVQAAVSSDAVLVALPILLILAAFLVRRQSPGLAWLSAGIAIAIPSIALWATVWSARSGASQPQLLAVEPVEGLASIWAATVGAWLLGWPAKLTRDAKWPALPTPGRKSAVALAVVAIAGVVSASGSFVEAYRTTIAEQLSGRTTVETIHADTVDRTYRAHRPAHEIARPGLVIVLHGSFGGGFQMESWSGFDAQADRLGWVAVYPDGVADGWDAFGSTDKWGKHPGADDVAFVSALIDHFEASDSVDPDRVYVTGISRGGMMSYRLGCELSGRIAAIAPVSGNMATATGSADVPCSLARPVSVLAIHGTADGTIPINGGMVDIPFSPMADVIARWRSLDRCATSSTVSLDGPSTTTTWACDRGATVSMRVVAGGAHTWPNVSGALASAGGSPDSSRPDHSSRLLPTLSCLSRCGFGSRLAPVATPRCRIHKSNIGEFQNRVFHPHGGMRAQGTVGAGVASIAGVEVGVASIAGVEIGVAFGSGLGETGGPIDPSGSTPDSPSPK
jgi:polyhydroxybutyrate depolymerase